MIQDSLRCPGMRDLLPQEMRRFRLVEDAFRLVCGAWGYSEVRTPTIEHLYLFTGAGTLSAQMLGRVYSFLDWDGWSGERVVLRPDATIPAVRLYVEELRDQKLARLFYVQNVFRFSTGDESREDWQCGVELIGDTRPAGDIELILLAREVIARLTAQQVTVKLSHPGLVRVVLAKAGFPPAEQLQLYDRILDGDASVFPQVEDRLPELSASLEVLLGMEGAGAAYLNNMRATFASVLPEIAPALEELSQVAAALEQLGCACLVSAALVRNFEYYTGPVFQFWADGEPVGGGGRYDSLVEQVSGDLQLPASGFAISIRRLMQLARHLPDTSHTIALAVIAAGPEPAVVAQAFQAAEQLRAAGCSAHVVMTGSGLAERPWLKLSAAGYVLSQPGKPEQTLDTLTAVAETMTTNGLANA